MKSAFELALERTGGKLEKIPESVKEKLNEIETFYRAKLAAAEFEAENRYRKAAGNKEKINQINQDLAVETASIRSKMEKEKKKAGE